MVNYVFRLWGDPDNKMLFGVVLRQCFLFRTDHFNPQPKIVNGLVDLYLSLCLTSQSWNRDEWTEKKGVSCLKDIQKPYRNSSRVDSLKKKLLRLVSFG